MSRISHYNRSMIAVIAGLLLIVGQMSSISVVTAYAAGEGSSASAASQYIAFTSDVHNLPNYYSTTQYASNASATRLGNWIDLMKQKYNIQYIGFCGDMADGHNREINGSIQDSFWDYALNAISVVLSKGVPACFTTGNHEYAPGNFDNTTSSAKQYYTVNAVPGNLPGNARYQIYAMGANNDDQKGEGITENQIRMLETYLSQTDSSKPVIIMSHFPLHHVGSGGNSRYTANADKVIEALNTAAEGPTSDPSDDKTIVFLWGHNHTNANSNEQNYDVIRQPGFSIMYSENQYKTTRFYYAAAGCMSDEEYSKGSKAVKAKGLIIQIKPDNSLGFGYFNASGSTVGTSTLTTDPVDPPAHVHSLSKTAAKAATCTVAGNSEYWYCSGCNKYYSDQEAKDEIARNSWVIQALGHDYKDVANSARAATCTEDGKEADKKCSRCDSTISGAKINKLGHNYTEVANSARAATCTEDGKEADKKCSRCDSTIEGAKINKLGHNWDYNNINWNWSANFSSATATFTCTRNGAHQEKKTASITSVTSGTTITYTAVVTGPNGSSYRDRKTDSVPQSDDPPSGGGNETPSGGGNDTPSGGNETPSGSGSDIPSGGEDPSSVEGGDTPAPTEDEDPALAEEDADTVEAIVFTPVEQYTYIENEQLHGYEDYDDDSKVFFRYDLPEFKNGDHIRVTDGRGTTGYYFDAQKALFVSGDGSRTIRVEDVGISSTQYEHHWEVGTGNAITITFRNVSCQVPVTIKESPITKMEFRPKREYTMIAYDTAYGDIDMDDAGEDYFFYNIPRFAEGDRMIVTMKDGTVREYIYQKKDGNGFFVYDAEKIPESNIVLGNGQYENHWLPGSTNEFTMWYIDQSYNVKVTIKKNPNNPLSVKSKTVTVKSASLKKRGYAIKAGKVFKTSNIYGKLTYKMIRKDKKAGKKIKVVKNGTVKIGKGLKKGTYKIKVKVTSSGNLNFKAKSKTVEVKIRVK